MRESTGLFLLVTIGLLSVQCTGKQDDTNTLNSLQLEDPPNRVSVKLMYAESHGISWTDLAYPNRLPPLHARDKADVLGIDYHYRRRELYFSSGGQIWRLQINDTAAAPAEQYGGLMEGAQATPEVVVGEAPGAAAVAVDWIRDLVYWSSPQNRSVWRANLRGGERTLVIHDTGNLTQQNNLVLDPLQGLLFLAVDGGGFLTADLDGRNQHRKILEFGDLQPFQGVTLAIDVANRRLFLSSQQDYVAQLVSCGYDGSELMEYDLTNQWWDKFTSLGVFGNQVFWVLHVPDQRDSVWKAEIGEDSTLNWDIEYRPDADKPDTRVWALKVFHPDLQSHEVIPEPDSVLNNSPQTQLPINLYILTLWCILFCYYE